MIQVSKYKFKLQKNEGLFTKPQIREFIVPVTGSGLRMRLFIDIFEFLNGVMCIYLGGGKAAMPQ